MNSQTDLERWKNRRGFTLIEVMVSVFIFSICLLGTISLISSQWKVLRRTQEQLYVTRILESRIEEIRDLTFDAVIAMDGTTAFPVLPMSEVLGETVNPDIDIEDYTRTLQESEGLIYVNTPFNGDIDLARITVRVSWIPPGEPQGRTLTSVTFMTRNGVGRQ